MKMRQFQSTSGKMLLINLEKVQSICDHGNGETIIDFGNVDEYYIVKENYDTVKAKVIEAQGEGV